MNQDEDRNDDARNSLPHSHITNDETGEIEQYRTLFPYRTREELFAYDEDSIESVVSSDTSSLCDPLHKIEHDENKHSIREQLNSIPGFSDCNDKISCLFDIGRRNPEHETEDITAKLNEISLNGALDLLFFSNSVHSQESNIKNTISRPCFSNPSDYHKQNLESPEEKNISSTSQASTSRHSNFRSCFFKAELPDLMSIRSPDLGTYSMIPSPISSTYMNSENPQWSWDPPHSNTSRGTGTHNPEFNSSSTSFDRLPSSPSNSFECPSNILRRNLSRSLEIPHTSSHDDYSERDYQRSNTCSSHSNSIRNTNDERNSPNSETVEERFLCSWEKHVASIQDKFNTEDHNYSKTEKITIGKIRVKNTSSLSDLPSTSQISPQSRSFRRFEDPAYVPKSARKLIFDDLDSGDDGKEKLPAAKENLSRVKENLARKFSETKEPRKKRKTTHISDSSENHSTLPKTDSEESVSKTTGFFPSTNESDENLSKFHKSEFPSSTLHSPKSLNSEIFEAEQSSRKRLISDDKASDSDKSDEKSKKKKLKQCDSNEKEKN